MDYEYRGVNGFECDYIEERNRMFSIISLVFYYKVLKGATEVKMNLLVILAPMICDLTLANIIFK